MLKTYFIKKISSSEYKLFDTEIDNYLYKVELDEEFPLESGLSYLQSIPLKEAFSISFGEEYD